MSKNELAAESVRAVCLALIALLLLGVLVLASASSAVAQESGTDFNHLVVSDRITFDWLGGEDLHELGFLRDGPEGFPDGYGCEAEIDLGEGWSLGVGLYNCYDYSAEDTDFGGYISIQLVR